MNKGFTLLELITVLAIIGILISISYPVYTQHIIKTRRSSAQVALLQLASGLERYRGVHNSYSGATLVDAELSQYTENNYYQLAINHLSDTTYLLQAIPFGSQTADQKCQILSLDQLGNKSISGQGEVEECW